MKAARGAGGRRWKPPADAALRRGWAAARELGELARELGRSPDAVCDRMAALGLGRVPDGWVTLDAGAALAGVNRRTLAGILARQGVSTARSYPAREGDRCGRSVIARRVEVVAAVATETREVETINGAARRRGLRPELLSRWLVAIGLHKVERGRRCPVRFSSDTIDAAVRWGFRVRLRD